MLEARTGGQALGREKERRLCEVARCQPRTLKAAVEELHRARANFLRYLLASLGRASENHAAIAMVAFTSMARQEALRQSNGMGGGFSSRLSKLLSAIGRSASKASRAVGKAGKAAKKRMARKKLDPANEKRLVPYRPPRNTSTALAWVGQTSRSAGMRARMARAGVPLKTWGTQAWDKARPQLALAHASYMKLKNSTSTKKIPADVKGLKRLRAMNKKQLARALLTKTAAGGISVAGMLGLQAAVDALGNAVKGGPEAAVDAAGNAVLHKIRQTSARAGPTSPNGAAADLAIGLLVDRTTGRFNTRGFMRNVRTVRKRGYFSRSPGSSAAFQSPASAAARKKRLKSYGSITYSGRSYHTPSYHAFGSWRNKKKKKKKKKKKTAKRKKTKTRRRSAYMSYDLFA